MYDDKIPTGIELFQTADAHERAVGRRPFLALLSAALLGVFVGTASPASAAVKVTGRGDAKGKKAAHAHKVAGTGDKQGKKTTYT